MPTGRRSPAVAARSNATSALSMSATPATGASCASGTPRSATSAPAPIRCRASSTPTPGVTIRGPAITIRGGRITTGSPAAASNWSRRRCAIRAYGSGFLAAFGILACGILEPGLDLARQLDRHRLTETVLRLACGDTNPAFRDRIFLDVGAFFTLATNADAALQHLHVEMGRARVGRRSEVHKYDLQSL